MEETEAMVRLLASIAARLAIEAYNTPLSIDAARKLALSQAYRAAADGLCGALVRAARV